MERLAPFRSHRHLYLLNHCFNLHSANHLKLLPSHHGHRSWLHWHRLIWRAVGECSRSDRGEQGAPLVVEAWKDIADSSCVGWEGAKNISFDWTFWFVSGKEDLPHCFWGGGDRGRERSVTEQIKCFMTRVWKWCYWLFDDYLKMQYRTKRSTNHTDDHLSV